jgi:hypothetical protein
VPRRSLPALVMLEKFPGSDVVVDGGHRRDQVRRN